MGELPDWSGLAHAEPGRLAFAGSLGSAHTHAHAAVQVLVVAAGEVWLTGGGCRVAVNGAAVIPTGAPHRISADRATGTMLYLDPLDRASAVLAADPASPPSDWLREPPPGDRAGIPGSAAELAELAADLPWLLAGRAPDRAPPPADRHPGLRKAVDLLPGLVHGPVRLTQVAEAVSLSADRLGRLFAEQLGLSFPAYLRWVRLRAAMDWLRGGGTLTDAAHAAGFTDSAHLNRVCHAMFGLAPTGLGAVRWD